MVVLVKRKNRRWRRMKLQNDFSNERTRRKWKLGIIGSGRPATCHWRARHLLSLQ
jgi:hypothetical protein